MLENMVLRMRYLLWFQESLEHRRATITAIHSEKHRRGFDFAPIFAPISSKIFSFFQKTFKSCCFCILSKIKTARGSSALFLDIGLPILTILYIAKFSVDKHTGGVILLLSFCCGGYCK